MKCFGQNFIQNITLQLIKMYSHVARQKEDLFNDSLFDTIESRESKESMEDLDLTLSTT